MILVTRLVPYSAMAVYPFILIKTDEMRNDAVLINHERIHHRQQLELLILPFYIIYGLNYLYHLAKLRNHYQAYRHILFEREAYAMEKDFDYLKRRRMFAFLKH
ncbi:MAG TPA: hypothetical protein PLW44_11045 [Chitinophagales bacterium]|nr:hypothetical protein [Chitinophagales bacterium]